MPSLLTTGLIVNWIALACGAMFVYQLLRQNGRVLARLDALEGELERSAGRKPPPPFGDRSLAGSRINRSGLALQTQAPDFRLPRADGGTLALGEYRGRRVLLVFSTPDCQPCHLLAPQLQRAWTTSDVDIVMVSRGDLETNRRHIARHRITFPVVLQRHWEISRAYGKFVTPMAYLIDEHGLIASDAAVGVQPILDLLSHGGSIVPAGEPGARGRLDTRH
jgi:peroxiredoxin